MSRITVTIVVVVLFALVALVAAAFVARPTSASYPDVCADLRDVESTLDQVAKFNHRLRVRRPELQFDRDSGGVTLELVSVYSYLSDVQRKLGCR